MFRRVPDLRGTADGEGARPLRRPDVAARVIMLHAFSLKGLAGLRLVERGIFRRVSAIWFGGSESS